MFQVDYTGFHLMSAKRFGHDFVDVVANPNDILLFAKKKSAPVRTDRGGGCTHGLSFDG